MSAYSTEINIDVAVMYDVIPGSRGARDSVGGVRGAGPPLEPDEPPDVEITAVLVGTKTMTDILASLPDSLVDSLKDEIIDQVAESQ